VIFVLEAIGIPRIKMIADQSMDTCVLSRGPDPLRYLAKPGVRGKRKAK
jgi:hypothetical protein